MEDNIDKAKELFEKGVELGSRHSVYKLGVIYKEEGNIEKAKKLFEKGAKWGDGVSAYCLGDIYREEGNIEKAKKCLKKAIELDRSGIITDKICEGYKI